MVEEIVNMSLSPGNICQFSLLTCGNSNTEIITLRLKSHFCNKIVIENQQKLCTCKDFKFISFHCATDPHSYPKGIKNASVRHIVIPRDMSLNYHEH